ncbi:MULTISPECIES: RsmB/NOP family class I SAM-dependent RNA methyltransferase [Agathobacter]|uniref:SAM-dependent MTase RsmB/NOP-type domain-containing protein n=1 Tax=Agathobacter ruminis TaxID=1712665 RepID=A0A2G3E0L1_9FIRM|nr:MULTISPECIES: RsmF rRNA methyltransferase first C-terminal domain-containing protein [Agathobacter]MBQ1681493.1 RsmF rRNA methyltransferase first C-terminal domain-containing protein [Agathobacter sp.]MDC7301338.1 RsmF rRNA methyltransferase first C-terminal domain-containing protein [Agathobacter ruminis]PHU36784.1 hypothetical protein CSX02_11470 [Agathobacter ruminis]
MTLPNEFIEHVRPLLDEGEMDAFLQSYDRPEYHGLRFRNEAVREKLVSNFADEIGLEDPVPWAPLSYYYNNEKRPGLHPFHEMGLYYIQEPSAMGPAALLSPNPGERVLDLCAAPGGKTTELAAFLKNEGLLVANEIHPARAKILASNVERMGITNALVLNEDSDHLAAIFSDFFHRILVDAPCSGEGMFRKNPDAIGEWSMENVQLCAKRQSMILDNAASMLMRGGTMVYSTCTFAKEENEDTVNAFLSRHPDFSLLKQVRFWPHKDKGEGHFMALLQKEGELSGLDFATRAPVIHSLKADAGAKNKKKKGSANAMQYGLIFSAFLQDNFTPEYADAFEKRIEANGILTFGEQWYLAPPQCPNLSGLKVLRAGLALGGFKKDRFEPEHAWAMALQKDQVLRAIELNETEAYAYLRGEAKMGLALEKKDCGYCLATYCSYPLGWGKATANQMKNHYPKGLRR